MSKFKVGDRVVFKQEGWRGRIVEIKDDGIHVVMFDDGSGDWFREDQLARNSALHSANPVVQNALVAANSSRGDAVLADYKKFVKAQMAAVLLALEKAKRDISAQGETSANTAKATGSTDEHEIIRDYSGKTAKAIDEAISKLKAAKDNPLIL